MQKINTTVFILMTLVFLPACGQKSYHDMLSVLYKNTVPLIEVEALTSETEMVFLLDTRSDKEYAVSHIEGARLIDYENFNSESVNDIPKDAQVVVYCSVGYRSERIGEQLQELDFTNVRNLYGGIFYWKNKGYTVVNNQNQPTDSVHAYNRLWGQWLNNATKIYE